MTVPEYNGSGASPHAQEDWETIDWSPVEKSVNRLQMRIAKAIREERYGKAKALQWLLTHSWSAKLFAVKRVTSNKGRKTAGIDGIIWKTPKDKMKAAQSMRRKGYSPKPLRRIYIPKKNGKKRGLGIPVMDDRAQQALYLLALEPISESLADGDSYGFRPDRATSDAVEQCFNLLAKRSGAHWILEGDIKACFDKIDHQWLVSHVPTDKEILKKWLAAGYIEKKTWLPTDGGTPQGGIISPALANMALDGLQETIAKSAPRSSKVHMVRYADDFVVTSTSKKVLEHKVKAAIEAFLKTRGLELSEEKTRITHIQDGFDFLGFNIRKYDGKLLIKPSKKNIESCLEKIRITVKSNRASTPARLIEQLNPKIRGFANYYKAVVSKKVFNHVDHQTFDAVYRWVKRRHPEKNKAWRKKRYFSSHGLNNWTFETHVVRKGKIKPLQLFTATSVPIRRHIKIRSVAHRYDPQYSDYFQIREQCGKTRDLEADWPSVRKTRTKYESKCRVSP